MAAPRPHDTHTTGRTGIRRVAVAAIVLIAVVSASIAPADPAAAHDSIAGSTPRTGSLLDEPIDHVEIDFGAEIGETVELFLQYREADGTEVDVGGTTTKTGPQTARLDFDLLEREGTYFVRYLTTIPSDGDVLFGEINFSIGTPTVQVSADENIRTSTPLPFEVLDDPITTATVTFVEPLAAEPEMYLIFDEGDGETFTYLEGVASRLLNEDTVLVSFPAIEREGTYLLRYDGDGAVSGDELAGVTPFVFGSPSTEGGDSFPWLLFLAAAIPILAIGAWMTVRRLRVVDGPDDPTDGSEVDQDLADVGV